MSDRTPEETTVDDVEQFVKAARTAGAGVDAVALGTALAVVYRLKNLEHRTQLVADALANIERVLAAFLIPEDQRCRCYPPSLVPCPICGAGT